MMSRIIWQSVLDPSVVVLTSQDALQLSRTYPDDPKYRQWVQILVIENTEPA